MPANPPAAEILDRPFGDALSERYLAYALSTITARSLPDVRDGLKPVHRRLLYAMRELRVDPDSAFKKCARIVGDVMGKFHPHGDSAIYEAMVRLAQDFAVRYPLVEGQGNFGNVDGDNPAAMRYTEARLTATAMRLLEGLDENAVDFRSTYDGADTEPVVLPAAVPHLLANGASGIAVGMATSIPPHNMAALCDALIALVDNPDVTDDELADKVGGPDFPTGGILAEDRGTIRAAYATGRGSLRVRARWQVERLSHGLFQIIITEIPYQVPKSRLIERLADLVNQKKLPALADVRDESTEDVRIVLEPRSRTVDADTLMEQLFRQTELETRFGLNLNVLDADGTPRVMSLREALQAWLEHRHVVLVRRTEHRVGRIAHRLLVLDGFLLAFLNLDEVIRIVREEDDPKAELMRAFSLNDVQAEAILNMRLRSLRRLEEEALRAEHAKLTAEQAELQALLGDPVARWQRIRGQISDVAVAYGPETSLGRRRTDLGAAPDAVEIPRTVAIEREPITVVLSRMGWIRALRGHAEDLDGLKFKEGDSLAHVLMAQTTDTILLFTSIGRAYSLTGDRLPGGRGHGEPLRILLDLPNEAEVVAILVHRPDGQVILAGSGGRGFRTAETALVGQTRAGKQLLNLGDGETAVCCVPVTGDHVAVVGTNRKLLAFPLDELPELQRGRGVILQKYKDGHLSDVATYDAAIGLQWRSGSGLRTQADMTAWLGRRGQVGRLPPPGFPRSNRFG